MRFFILTLTHTTESSMLTHHDVIDICILIITTACSHFVWDVRNFLIIPVGIQKYFEDGQNPQNVQKVLES